MKWLIFDIWTHLIANSIRSRNHRLKSKITNRFLEFEIKYMEVATSISV